MILKIRKNDSFQSGIIEINYKNNTIEWNIKFEAKEDVEPIFKIPAIIEAGDLLNSFSFRLVGEIKTVGEWTLVVKSKDCCSVKLAVSNRTFKEVKGEILLATNDITVKPWRIDLIYPNRKRKLIHLRAMMT